MIVTIETVNDGMRLVDCSVCGTLGVWRVLLVAREVKRTHVCGQPLANHLATSKWSARDRISG